MSNSPKSNTPYKTLGSSLRRLRNKHNKSASEVCGAVEIDENLLVEIEAGNKRPSEELLEQLINHYQMEDDDALSLWSMAGYDIDDLMIEDFDPLDSRTLAKSIIMLMSIDQRTLYSDSMDIYYDTKGLVLNFKQTTGQKQSSTVVRVGMSYEQAEQVRATLSRVLLRHKYLKGPKALPDGQ